MAARFTTNEIEGVKLHKGSCPTLGQKRAPLTRRCIMRLNLRLLLDYLDDRLDPEATRILGEYLAENERPRQLVEHMRRGVRRRRLSTPDVAERAELPPHHQDDPNVVAAYLDRQLTPEQEAAFEEICLDTDVYLAE